jgi:ATP-dependent exoDNAse (exonuclease V) beta subunit
MSAVTATELDRAGLMTGYARVSDVLRVGGLLPDFSRIPPHVLERKRQIGTATHAAIDLLLRGQLDRASLDPAVAPYFSAAERWLVERKPFVVACEETVCDRKRLIKGTLDLRVRLDGEHLVVDFKTSNELSVAACVQVEGYRDLYGQETDGGLVVHLKKDSTYSDTTRAAPDHAAEWARSSGSYVFKRDHGLLPKDCQ